MAQIYIMVTVGPALVCPPPMLCEVEPCADDPGMQLSCDRLALAALHRRTYTVCFSGQINHDHIMDLPDDMETRVEFIFEFL